MDRKRSGHKQPNRSKKISNQTQGILAWSTYQDSLRELDKRLMDQFHQTVSTLRFTFLLNIFIYTLFFIFLVLVFFYSSKLTLTNSIEPIWGGAIAIASLVVLAIMIYRNPVKEITQIASDLAKVQIILQGYNRQINQVDAVFKQAVLSGTLNVTMLNRSLDQLQEAIDSNVESITHSLEEIDF